MADCYNCPVQGIPISERGYNYIMVNDEFHLEETTTALSNLEYVNLMWYRGAVLH